MSQEFDNLKSAVANAVTVITEAIDRIASSDNPAEMQAEADKLSAAVVGLSEALHPTPPVEEPPVEEPASTE